MLRGRHLLSLLGYYGVMSELTPEDAALIGDAVSEKVGREARPQNIEFATVVATSYVEGVTPYVVVKMAGAADGETTVVPSITGSVFTVGQRVAIKWEPPAGAYVFGYEGLAIVPCARLSNRCGGSSE